MPEPRRTPTAQELALAKNIDDTATREAESMIAGMAPLPPGLRRILLEAIARKLLAAAHA